MKEGIYEALVTQLVENKLLRLDHDDFYIKKSRLDKAEASTLLSKHLAHSIKTALSTIRGEHQIEEQIEIANKIILFLKDELKILMKQGSIPIFQSLTVS